MSLNTVTEPTAILKSELNDIFKCTIAEKFKKIPQSRIFLIIFIVSLTNVGLLIFGFFKKKSKALGGTINKSEQFKSNVMLRHITTRMTMIIRRVVPSLKNTRRNGITQKRGMQPDSWVYTGTSPFSPSKSTILSFFSYPDRTGASMACSCTT